MVEKDFKSIGPWIKGRCSQGPTVTSNALFTSDTKERRYVLKIQSQKHRKNKDNGNKSEKRDKF